jgi:hypothetical protein
MNESSARGRFEFLAVVGAMTLLLLLIALGVWLRGAEFNPVSQLGRVVVFVGLAALAYGGARWARTVLAVWTALLALTSAVLAINAGFASAAWALIAFVFAAAATYASFLLFTSSAIDSFLAEGKSKRAE